MILIILHSAATCVQQAAHTDYNTTAPLSLLAGISRDSTLILWFPDTNGVLRPRVIDLPRGQAILFHGAQAHSGADYTTDNYRIFCYLQQSTYVEAPRQTHQL